MSVKYNIPKVELKKIFSLNHFSKDATARYFGCHKSVIERHLNLYKIKDRFDRSYREKMIPEEKGIIVTGEPTAEEVREYRKKWKNQKSKIFERR